MMVKKKILGFLILGIILTGQMGFTEENVPNQQTTNTIAEIKEAVANLPEDISLASSTVNSLVSKCEEIVKTDEKFAEGYLYLGICYLAKENFDESSKSADKVIALDQTHPDGYFLRGIALMVKSLKDGSTSFVESIADFEKVLSIDPNYKSPTIAGDVVDASKIMLLIGNMSMESNQLEKAKEVFALLLEKYPESQNAEIAAEILKGLKQQTLIEGQVKE